MAITRTGGGWFSITRICTVLVCERSSVSSDEVEVVGRVARRVDGRDVQGLEVVERVLDLRPARDGEAEPAEEVDQLLGRLRQRVAMAELRDGAAGAGDVDAAGDGRWGDRRGLRADSQAASSAVLTALNRWP